MDGRYLSASEAAWRFFEFDVTHRDRPAGVEFDGLTYLDYHKLYNIGPTAAKTAKRVWLDQAPPEKQYKVWRRFKSHVARMTQIWIKSGDVRFLRQILEIQPARSYTDLVTVHK